jgi:exopolyphosphatase / guanosine-5'-triphosphate,3'-diphosphate pyrophosphatase
LRRRSAMTTKTPRSRETAERPLELDPERVTRAARPPYAIVDIGSNSVRLMVYDQLGRAPMPRFNEKSVLRLGEGLAQTGAIAAERFRQAVQAVRRFRAIADAMGVSRIDATATEAMRRASNGPALAAAIARESGLKVRILTGEEEARYATLGVISGFFSPRRAGGRHGRRQPRGRGGDRRSRRRRLGQLAARRAAGRGDARQGSCGGQAQCR